MQLNGERADHKIDAVLLNHFIGKPLHNGGVDDQLVADFILDELGDVMADGEFPADQQESLLLL